jgi:hypothetical protein
MSFVASCRYQLRVCVEACRAHLLGLDAKGLAWGTALAMLRLPAGLRESDAFAAVTEVECCEQKPRAYCMYGSSVLERVCYRSLVNVAEAWTSGSSRMQWLTSPALLTP